MRRTVELERPEMRIVDADIAESFQDNENLPVVRCEDEGTDDGEFDDDEDDDLDDDLDDDFEDFDDDFDDDFEDDLEDDLDDDLDDDDAKSGAGA